jgi:hypothetical protein
VAYLKKIIFSVLVGIFALHLSAFAESVTGKVEYSKELPPSFHDEPVSGPAVGALVIRGEAARALYEDLTKAKPGNSRFARVGSHYRCDIDADGDYLCIVEISDVSTGKVEVQLHQ